MKRAISLILTLFLCFSLCSCTSIPVETTAPYLSEYEARQFMDDVAEPALAEAVGIPSYAFRLSSVDYDVLQRIHNEDMGYWYFEIEGRIPMADSGGLWYIEYTFDAKVDHITGSVTLGSLSISNPCP